MEKVTEKKDQEIEQREDFESIEHFETDKSFESPSFADMFKKAKPEMEKALDEIFALSVSISQEEKEDAIPTPELVHPTIEKLEEKIALLKSEFKGIYERLKNTRNELRETKENSNHAEIGPEAFLELRKDFIRASLLIKEGQESNKKVIALAGEIKESSRILRDLKLKQLGIREEESVDDLYRRKVNEKRGLEGRLGFGRLWHSKEIMKLEEEAIEVSDYLYQRDEFRSSSVVLSDYELREPLRKLVEQASSHMEAIVKKSTRENGEDFTEVLSEEQITRLEELYMEEKVEPELKKLEKVDEEDLQTMRSLVRRSLSLPQKSYSSNPEEERKKMWELKADIEKLPYNSLREVERLWPKDPLSDRFQKIATLIKRIDALEESEAVKDMQIAFVQKFDKLAKTASREAVFYPSHSWYYPGLKGIEDMKGSLPVDEFNLIEGDTESKEFFGEQNLGKTRRYLEKYVEQRIYLVSSVKIENNTTSEGNDLIRMGGSANLIPIVLNSFRDTGYSGERPFVSSFSGNGDTPPLKAYIESLTEDDLDRVQEMDIPGLGEIISFIKEGKNLSLIYNDFELDEEEKETRLFLHKNLAKLLEYQISVGTPQMEGFFIDLAMRVDHDLGESYDYFNSSVTLNNQEKLEGMAWHRCTKYGDTKSLELMSRIDDFLYSEDSEALNEFDKGRRQMKMVRDFLDILEKQGESLSVDARKVFAKACERGLASQSEDARFLSIRLSEKLGNDINIYQDDLVELFLKSGRYQEAGGIGGYLNEIIGKEAVILSDNNIELVAQHIENLATTHVVDNLSSLKPLVSTLSDKKIISKERFERIFGIVTAMEKDSYVAEINKADAITEENWRTLLSWYAAVDGGRHTGEPVLDAKLLAMFSNEHPDNRNLCLEKLQESWRDFLSTRDLDTDGLIISRVGEKYEGIGDLQYITGISNMISQLDTYSRDSQHPKKTKDSLFNGLEAQEKRFDKERWSDEEKTYFYTVSKDILSASPSLYTDYLSLLEQLKPKEMKSFVKEYFGAYQAMMIVLDKGKGVYNGRELVPLRKQIRRISEKIGEGENPEEQFKESKDEVVEYLKAGFMKRLGLIKVPSDFSYEHIRTMQNFIRYAANLNDKDNKKEALLALYMSLSLNGEWQNFRQGKEIDISEHLSPEKLQYLSELKERKPYSSIEAEGLGIDEEDMPGFMALLQDETIANMIGNIETVDVKLGNIKRALTDLDDPDAYEHEEDKRLLKLYQDHGKSIGSTLAKQFGILSKGKGTLEAKEAEIITSLEAIYNVKEWTAEEVKRVQEETKSIGLVHSILQKIEQEDVDGKIESLRTALLPSDGIISIFKDLGESFESHSGAIALSEDLSYLENIIVKNADKLSEENKKELSEYLERIRDKMKLLEATQYKLKEYFEKIHKSTHGSKRSRLNERLEEIREIMYSKQLSVNIVSKMTGDLNPVIENIRQCLGCLTAQCNNDTNLTFGEPYRFLALSQSGEQKGSVADELIMFLKTNSPEGVSGYSFVLDNLYGTKSSDILLSNINVVNKKLSAIKDKFPNAKVSMTVTRAALSSAGISRDVFVDRCQKEFPMLKVASTSEHEVSFPTSALGDNYSEFVGSTRPTGNYTVSGVILSL